MGDETQLRLLNSVYVCLRPISRLLLRSGITYKQFAEIAKRAFLEEAFAEADPRGRKPNASRVAARTGLSRKEIRKLAELAAISRSVAVSYQSDRAGPLARVLYAWHTDPRFLDKNGKPLELRFDDDGFIRLVRMVAGDLPAGAVRAELRRAGAIKEVEDGKLAAIKRYYVPSDVDERAVAVMSGMVFPLAAGVEHNANPSRTKEGFIQRFAFSDQLPEALVPMFRKWARGQATEFIELMDDWLSQNETEAEGPEGSHSDRRVGIGVFYYEGPSAENLLEPSGSNADSGTASPRND